MSACIDVTARVKGRLIEDAFSVADILSYKLQTMAELFATLSKSQLVVKIANDITQYRDKQVKLSLLQDLIINLLPDTGEHDSPTNRKLQSIRCHMNSEDVTGWLDAILMTYLQTPGGAQTFETLTPTQVLTPYYS
jgi:16S rRNA C1402 N4-methylase RsmH